MHDGYSNERAEAVGEQSGFFGHFLRGGVDLPEKFFTVWHKRDR
jgi:hypothetical protein